MASHYPCHAKITIEMQTGEVYSGIAYKFAITQSNYSVPIMSIGHLDPVSYVQERAPTFEVVASCTKMDRYPSIDEYQEKKPTSEYECLWCGATNLKERRQCPQCGGFRPVL